MSQAGSRLIFANQLRGLAALCVLVSHLVGVFWAMRDFVGLATASPPPTGAVPAVFRLVSFTWFNFGPFGVGVFFLISGLVIPISLERHTRASFLLARLLRIFPTYIAAMAIDVALLHAAASYWQRPFPYGNTTILGNLLLTYNLVGLPSIDLVNWTLCIELKFYLLMALLAPLIRRGSVAGLFAVALALFIGNAALAGFGTTGFATGHAVVLQALSSESGYLVFMLIGVLFNYRLRGLLRPCPTALAIGAMLVLFIACCRLSPLRDQVPINTVNYLYALTVFALAYRLRARARAFAPLDALAAISFPLYLIHSMVGFLCLKLVMLVAGWSYSAALPVAVTAAVIVATLLHRLIERPSIHAGRLLSRAPISETGGERGRLRKLAASP